MAMGLEARARLSPTGPGRPPGPSRAVRRAVLEATRAELVERGYGLLTPEQVAQRAGVGRSTVYRHWGSRAALVRDALVQWQQASAPVITSEGNWAADVRNLCDHMRAELLHPLGPALLRVMVMATADDESLTDALHDLWRTRTEGGLELIEQARDRGEIPAAVSVVDVFEMMTSMFMTRVLVTHLPLDDDFVNRVCRLVLDATGAGDR